MGTFKRRLFQNDAILITTAVSRVFTNLTEIKTINSTLHLQAELYCSTHLLWILTQLTRRWKPLRLNTANITRLESAFRLTVRIEAKGNEVHNNDPLKVSVSSWFITHLLYTDICPIHITFQHSAVLSFSHDRFSLHWHSPPPLSLSVSLYLSGINNDG
jgi:hypothetical protein